MRKISLLLAALLLPCLTFGRQAYEGPMRFSTFWPCNGNASFCGIRILAEGAIQPDTGKKFAEFLKNPKLHKHELPPRPTIVFNSSGGSVIGGIELGRAIRKNKLHVELAKSYSKVKDGDSSQSESLVDRAVCASACVIAFSGGVKRSIQAGSRMGIHQFSATQGNIGDGATQVTIVVLASYFEEMGVNRTLLDKSSLVAASSIAWISDVEAKQFRLDNKAPYLTPWKVSPTPAGDAVVEVLQQVSFGRSASIRISVAKGTGILAVATILEKSAIGRDRVAQFPENELPEIDVCTERRCIKAQAIRPWLRRDSDTLTAFQGLLTLSLSELREISRAKSLTITDNFGNATSDVSISSELSTEGIASGIALLLKLK